MPNDSEVQSLSQQPNPNHFGNLDVLSDVQRAEAFEWAGELDRESLSAPQVCLAGFSKVECDRLGVANNGVVRVCGRVT